MMNPSCVSTASHAQRAQLLAQRADAVRFFVAQLFRLAHQRVALGEGRRHGKSREFVDHAHHQVAADLRAMQRLCAHGQIAQPARRACSPLAAIWISAPIAGSASSSPVRVGFSPTSRRITSEPGVIRAATIRKAAAEISPGQRQHLAAAMQPAGGARAGEIQR